ncbi:DUF1501 domain-containing protein [Trinickia diaoshuihuensis]|uniref:DUF1501 domain-containing protein n=1 Tax=Trinickia diaoshuihuensis TaxID=2292265 RepID=UPI000E233D78|nr:DUF1501 domain-containing protein [Trinickia diaoshuihuensis]
MLRRRFLRSMTAAAAVGLSMPIRRALAQSASTLAPAPPRAGAYRNLLILVELKGGNDGLNTVVPYDDPNYRLLRKHIGIDRERVIALDERTGLHPALEPLMPLWRDGHLAIVQGVSYAQPNLSHFRSIEIWNTASRADEYLNDGWLTRAFAEAPVPAGFAADALVIGSAEMGPFDGGARAVALVNPAQFAQASRLVRAVALRERNAQLAHILDVENDIVHAALRLTPHPGQFVLKTAFPAGAFGASVKTAMQALASAETPRGQPIAGQGVAAIRLTLNGFDTHQNQLGQHAALLAQLAQGLAAMRSSLIELGRWDDTLIMTYAEFGRRPHENESNGTDHGTVAPHFVAGGRVRGGLYGAAPDLARLDGNGNLPVGVDFRRMYATVLGPWWGLDASRVLRGRFDPLPLLRS